VESNLEIHLIDGTYELFRHYYALPGARDPNGIEVAAVRGVLASVLGMMRDGVTHLAVATDHVIAIFCLSSLCLKMRSQPPGSSCGRWWSSKQTMLWPPQPRSRPTTRVSTA
jgi:hypothetical protein